MNTFLITTVIKGVQTKVVVEEPPRWDIPEFFISVTNPVICERFRLRLEEGLWQYFTPCSLEPLEIENIGLEIAKCWRMRLSKTLDLFEQLF